MAISPLAQASAPTPAQQAQSAGMRAAEMEQEPSQTQSLATSAMDEVRKQREAMNQAVERMISSLDRRKAIPFDPMLMKMSAAFLKPTKTGSFGESMGYAAEAAAGEVENEYARQQAQAKLELELQQKLLESKQRMAGTEFLQGFMPGAPQGGMGAPQAPRPAAPMGAEPMGAPAGVPGGAPVVAQAPQMTGGVRRVTPADIMRAEQTGDPQALKILQAIYDKQIEEEKLGVQERGLEFNIPGTRRVIKNVPLAEQREAQGVYQRSLRIGDPQIYFRYLVEKGWIEPEYAEAEPGGERKLLPPQTPEQEKGAEKRAAVRAETEEKARADLMTAARLAGTVVRDTDQVIRFASDPKTSGTFGVLAEPGVVNALGGLVASGMQTPKGSIGVPEIENALRKLGKSQAEIDAAMMVLQPITNMELNFTRIFLAGGGQITEGERAIVRRLPPSLSDSPKVAIAKSETLKARAIFDKERAKLFRDWERRNPRMGLDDFQDSEDYKRLEKLYDDQLFKIQETYFPSTKEAPKQSGTMGPLESRIRNP